MELTLENWKICNLVKNKREQLGETQEAFGKRFNISHSAISELESGKTKSINEDMLVFVMQKCEHRGMQYRFTAISKCLDCGYEIEDNIKPLPHEDPRIQAAIAEQKAEITQQLRNLWYWQDKDGEEVTSKNQVYSVIDIHSPSPESKKAAGGWLEKSTKPPPELNQGSIIIPDSETEMFSSPTPGKEKTDAIIR